MQGAERINRLVYRLGWCPGQHAMKTETTGRKKPVSAPDELKGSVTTIFRRPDLFVTVSIVILFATIFLGGYFWWPLFVGAILVTGLGYTCVCTARRMSS